MTKYAAQTTVSTQQSRMEIERTLERYGASSFAYMSDAGRAMIAFAINGRRIKFVLNLPIADDPSFTTYRRGSSTFRREPEQAVKLWEQACRQKWRALALVIKAKLEAVSAGITTVEDEFLAHTVLPNGSTVGEAIQEQIALTYRDGSMPPLLGHG